MCDNDTNYCSMPKVPFPHVLSSRIELGNGIIRIVTDKDIESEITQYDTRESNAKTGKLEEVYWVYRFTEIKEKRPARGDWSNWDRHPTYYNGVGTVKRVYESEMSVSVT